MPIPLLDSQCLFVIVANHQLYLQTFAFNFLPSYRWRDYVTVVFFITPQLLVGGVTEQV